MVSSIEFENCLFTPTYASPFQSSNAFVAFMIFVSFWMDCHHFVLAVVSCRIGRLPMVEYGCLGLARDMKPNLLRALERRVVGRRCHMARAEAFCV